MNPKIRLTTIVLTAFLLSFSAPAFSQSCPEHQALLDKVDEIFENKAIDRLGEVYHADAVIHNPEGTMEGLEAIIAANKKFFAQVSDADGENLDVICNGDKMVVRWKGSGKMNGKEVSVTGITIYHVRDGKIAEVWEEMDMMNLMVQMGYQVKPPAGVVD